MYTGETLERWYLNTEATWGQSKTDSHDNILRTWLWKAPFSKGKSTFLWLAQAIPDNGSAMTGTVQQSGRVCVCVCGCVCVCVCARARARVLWGRDVLDVIKDWPSSRGGRRDLKSWRQCSRVKQGYFSFLAETLLDNEHVLCRCNGGVTTFSGSHLKILSRAWLEGRLWWGWRKVCITLWVSIGRVYT